MIELTDREREMILAALNVMVKQASNSLQAANEVLPLAMKIQNAKPAQPQESQ